MPFRRMSGLLAAAVGATLCLAPLAFRTVKTAQQQQDAGLGDALPCSNTPGEPCCNPDANPAQSCPGPVPCPACGTQACQCPPTPAPTPGKLQCRDVPAGHPCCDRSIVPPETCAGALGPLECPDCGVNNCACPPAPAPMPPAPTVLSLENDSPDDGVVFCRAAAAFDGVYLDEQMTVPAKGSAVDVGVLNSPQAARWGPGAVGVRATLALELERGGSAKIFVDKYGQWETGVCWFQDLLSHQVKSLSAGPAYQGEFEFTIKASSETAVVSFDLTFVEGFAGGLNMGYERDDGLGIAVNATPARPLHRQIVAAPDYGFRTVLSDKWLEGTCPESCLHAGDFKKDPQTCGSRACRAGCPAGLSDDPCGQNACRRFFASQYQDPTSYCSWLLEEKVQGYCWAMDEWMCVGTTESPLENCGYGGTDQPALDLSADYPCPSAYPGVAIGSKANDWSCGHSLGSVLNWPAGNPWWPTEVGCVDKKVTDAAGAEAPTNPEPFRAGGTLTMTVVGSSWLKANLEESAAKIGLPECVWIWMLVTAYLHFEL